MCATRYVVTPCNATHDTVCSSCDVCGVGEFASVACDGVRNAQCSSCATCVFDNTTRQFEGAPCTSSSDRVCSTCSVGCPGGTFQSAACTPTSDRVCTSFTPCNFATEFISTVGTPFSDRVCSPLTVCARGSQFESVPATTVSDRTCTNYTVCSPGFEELTAGNATHDRVCGFDGVCDGRTDAFDLVFLLDASGSLGATNFDMVKTFASNISSRLSYGPTQTRVAVVLFHFFAEEIFDFNTGNSAAAVSSRLAAITSVLPATHPHRRLRTLSSHVDAAFVKCDLWTGCYTHVAVSSRCSHDM